MSAAGEGRDLLRVDLERGDGVTVVRVGGELDYPAKGLLLATLEELLLGVEPFIVDLTDLTFIDSSGLGALVRVNNEARDQRGPLTVVCPPGGRVSHLIHLTGLERVLRVFETVEHAVAAARADVAG